MVDKCRNALGNVFIILTMVPIMMIALFLECLVDACEWILEIIEALSDRIKIIAYKIKGIQ